MCCPSSSAGGAQAALWMRRFWTPAFSSDPHLCALCCLQLALGRAPSRWAVLAQPCLVARSPVVPLRASALRSSVALAPAALACLFPACSPGGQCRGSLPPSPPGPERGCPVCCLPPRWPDWLSVVPALSGLPESFTWLGIRPHVPSFPSPTPPQAPTCLASRFERELLPGPLPFPGLPGPGPDRVVGCTLEGSRRVVHTPTEPPSRVVQVAVAPAQASSILSG